MLENLASHIRCLSMWQPRWIPETWTWLILLNTQSCDDGRQARNSSSLQVFELFSRKYHFLQKPTANFTCSTASTALTIVSCLSMLNLLNQLRIFYAKVHQVWNSTTRQPWLLIFRNSHVWINIIESLLYCLLIPVIDGFQDATGCKWWTSTAGLFHVTSSTRSLGSETLRTSLYYESRSSNPYIDLPGELSYLDFPSVHYRSKLCWKKLEHRH